MGVYGGTDHEGVLADDRAAPKRFFALYSDKALLGLVMSMFTLRYFRSVDVWPDSRRQFQSLILRT